MKIQKYQNPSGPTPVVISTDYKENLEGIPQDTVFGYSPELGLYYEEAATPENLHTMSPEIQKMYYKGKAIAAKQKLEEEQKEKLTKERIAAIQERTKDLGEGDSATE